MGLTMENVNIELFEYYYNELKVNFDYDDYALELWQSLLNKAIEYTNIRVKWSFMSNEEKIEKDSYRTACHDSLINSLKVYIRYLKQLGINLSVNELIEKDRKTIGDFANYIVFTEAVKNR